MLTIDRQEETTRANHARGGNTPLGSPSTPSSETIPGWLRRRVMATPFHPAYWQRLPEGRWDSITWNAVAARVENLAVHLRHLGLVAGDRVAIMMPTSPEWECCQLAVLSLGAVVVGLDAHDAPENHQHILGIVSPRALFTTNQAQLELLRTRCPLPPEITLPLESSSPSGLCLRNLLLTRAEPLAPRPLVSGAEVATIIFTSGSTGQPKGIAYTHEQLCRTGRAILARYPGIDHAARLACWLPLSNLFQRVINLCALMCGAQSYFVETPADIARLLPEIRPNLFIGVPRFYERLHSRIQADIARRPWPIRRMVEWAWRTGERYQAAHRLGIRPGTPLNWAHGLADKLVLTRLRDVMGGDIHFMVSGSASLPPWLLERLHGLGWLVLEAYGTSECVMPVASNTVGAYRIGSVGRPLPENEFRLAEDGEILIRGPSVFKGYIGATESASPLDAEGYLHTGDMGRLDEAGYLWLTGRKSEMFKTSTGRRIAPVAVEFCLKRLPWVEQAVVFGRDRPVPAALLCLDLSSRPDIAADQPLPAPFLDELGQRVLQACASLPVAQRPAAIVVTRRNLSILEGELTSNLKLRRDVIETRYRAALDRVYDSLSRSRDRQRITLLEAP